MELKFHLIKRRIKEIKHIWSMSQVCLQWWKEPLGTKGLCVSVTHRDTLCRWQRGDVAVTQRPHYPQQTFQPVSDQTHNLQHFSFETQQHDWKHAVMRWWSTPRNKDNIYLEDKYYSANCFQSLGGRRGGGWFTHRLRAGRTKPATHTLWSKYSFLSVTLFRSCSR